MKIKCPNCNHEFTTNLRTGSQNNSIHLFFEWIANAFNELGHTYTNPMGIETFWTKNLVKEVIWKPLQMSLYGTDSTTKLEKDQINLIADGIIKHFSEQGYELKFPSLQSFLNHIDKQING